MQVELQRGKPNHRSLASSTFITLLFALRVRHLLPCVNVLPLFHSDCTCCLQLKVLAHISFSLPFL